MDQASRHKMLVTVELAPIATDGQDGRLSRQLGDCLLDLWGNSEQRQRRTLKGPGWVSRVCSHGESLDGERGVYLFDDDRIMRVGEVSGELLVHALNLLQIEIAERLLRQRR